MPDLPAMTGAEMKCTREFLGLSLGWLSADMTMDRRRMERMELDQESIPDGLVSRLDDISEETRELLHEMIAEYRRKVKASEGDGVTLKTYRNEKDVNPDVLGKFPPSWHRMLCARVAAAVPGLVLAYT